MSQLNANGGCFCGQYRFECAVAASSSCYCHCHSCRRASGAPVLAWVEVPKAHLKVVKGELHVYASSPGVLRGFCNQCGTHISYQNAQWPNNVDITLVSLDNAADYPPQKHIWVSDKMSGLSLDDHLPQHAEWGLN